MRKFYLKIYVLLTPNLFVQKGFKKEKTTQQIKCIFGVCIL